MNKNQIFGGAGFFPDHSRLESGFVRAVGSEETLFPSRFGEESPGEIFVLDEEPVGAGAGGSCGGASSVEERTSFRRSAALKMRSILIKPETKCGSGINPEARRGAPPETTKRYYNNYPIRKDELNKKGAGTCRKILVRTTQGGSPTKTETTKSRQCASS